MQKTDKTIIKETKYIAVFTAALSVLMQIIFIVLKMWSYKVLLGNILSAFAVILNFFLMGRTVQKAVATDEAEAKKILKTSQMLRTLFLFIAIVIGVVLPCFSIYGVIIPLFFPRAAIAFRPLWKESANNE